MINIIIIELVKNSWYLWALIIFFSILNAFQPKIKGYLGEKAVSNRLSKLDQSKYKVINNLMLQVGNKTTQIDHIVVSNYGIFVIETKNYMGWIIGNEYDEYCFIGIYLKRFIGLY